jgi:hypothetical protein
MNNPMFVLCAPLEQRVGNLQWMLLTIIVGVAAMSMNIYFIGGSIVVTGRWTLLFRILQGGQSTKPMFASREVMLTISTPPLSTTSSQQHRPNATKNLAKRLS